MLSVNFLNILLYLLTRISLLMDHFSVRSTAAFSVFLSFSTSAQSYIIWSIVCSFLHEHVGLSMILYLYKYDLIVPCPVTNAVKFGVTLFFSFNLSAILGKHNFVIAPFVVQCHSLCHFLHCFHLIHFHCAFWDFAIALVDIVACCCHFRQLVASSFLWCHACALIQLNSIIHLWFSNFITFFLICSIRCVWFFRFLSNSNAIRLSVNICTVISSVSKYCYVFQCF